MKVITTTELRISLFTFPRAYQLLVDTDYALPTTSWLLTTFYPWWQDQRNSLGLTTWTRINDCDNFARAYAQAAQDCYALTPVDGTRPEALAVGELCYIKDGSGGHAIVLAITEDGKVFIEPQTGKRIFLSPTEIDSCFFVRF